MVGLSTATILWSTELGMYYTKVEVFMEKGVCVRAQTAGANSRRGATKKREISFHAPFFLKSTLQGRDFVRRKFCYKIKY